MARWKPYILLRFLVFLTWCSGLQAFGSETPDPSETLGFKDLDIICQRLISNLSKVEAKAYTPELVVTDPSQGLVFLPIQSDGRNAVRVSAGSLKLLSRISYAMAANRFQADYLQSYLKILAQYDGSGTVPELPANSTLDSKSAELSNEHLSNFNQISAGILSIVLNTPSVPTKDPPQDLWIKSLRKGIPNSLTSAYGIEGLADFFDALEKMPTRPGWVDQFIPPGVKAVRARKELKRIHRDLLR